MAEPNQNMSVNRKGEESTTVLILLEELLKNLSISLLLLNPFAGAYYHRDEPHFNELATIYGYYDVKVEAATEVITISDNTELIVITDTVEPNAPVRGRVKQLDVDLDEVNSPSPGAACRVRRKLFQVEPVNLDMDHLSSSKSPSRVIPAKKLTGSSPKGSSGASCSPLPTSRKTAP
ncbi:hypothetical protein SASPL_152628 [Salvia splendens]|uniref:Uncharacterized protein n=1 Tax=Salvia splendens TaxID=180675 RepID=A0A8X8W3H4_SALSN|nr:hypothetical protein SASPL_152628 [Salvia splendens]